MKFKVSKENLSKALSLTNKAISVKSPLPILQNVLIQSDGPRLKFAATDLDKTIITWADAQVEGEFSTTIPAKVFFNFVNSLKTDELIGEVVDDTLHLSAKGTQASFNGMNVEDFPELNYAISENHFSLDSDTLKDFVSHTHFSTSIDDSTNPAWTGILIQKGEEDLHFVSLDGNRLSKKTLELKDIKLSDDLDSLILPAKNLIDLSRLSKSGASLKVDFQKERGIVLFDLDGLIYISKTLDGSFPDYNSVIPQEFASEFAVDHALFLDAIKTAAIFAQTHQAIRLKINSEENLLEITSDDVELGKNKQVLPITDIIGATIEVAFKTKYLLDYLNNISSEKVFVKLSGQATPAMFMPTDSKTYLHLAVPLQPYWEEEGKS